MTHKRIIFVSFLLLLISLMCLFTFGQGVGYIQIKCEPGAMVFLDNNLVGNTSSELAGLILQDVPTGSHQIKIIKEGFEPQSVKIDLKVNEIYVYEVKEFIPKLDVTQKGEADTDTIKQRVGSLLIETIPIDCIIEIPKLNINEEHYGDKTKKTWEISKIPVGNYRLYFIALGKKIEYNLKIEEGDQKHLLVNILKNEVKEIVPEACNDIYFAAHATVFIDGKYYEAWAMSSSGSFKKLETNFTCGNCCDDMFASPTDIEERILLIIKREGDTASYCIGYFDINFDGNILTLTYSLYQDSKYLFYHGKRNYMTATHLYIGTTPSINYDFASFPYKHTSFIGDNGDIKKDTYKISIEDLKYICRTN